MGFCLSLACDMAYCPYYIVVKRPFLTTILLGLKPFIDMVSVVPCHTCEKSSSFLPYMHTEDPGSNAI